MRVELHKDGRVRVNGMITPLPLHLQHTQVVRSSHNEVRLIDTRGFFLKYDLLHDVATLKLSGWLHGRVRGLLGCNDYEAFNDILYRNDSYAPVSEVSEGGGWVTHEGWVDDS